MSAVVRVAVLLLAAACGPTAPGADVPLRARYLAGDVRLVHVCAPDVDSLVLDLADASRNDLDLRLERTADPLERLVRGEGTVEIPRGPGRGDPWRLTHPTTRGLATIDSPDTVRLHLVRGEGGDGPLTLLPWRLAPDGTLTVAFDDPCGHGRLVLTPR